MKIHLNNEPYWITNLTSDRYEQWPEQLRTTGEQLRADRAPFPLWAPDDLLAGMGRKNWKAGEASYLFGSCETRWGRATLPLRIKSCDLNADSTTALFKDYCDSKGNTYGLILDEGASKCVKWDSSNAEWDVVGTIDAADCDGAYSIIEHEGNLQAVSDDNGTLHTYKSTNAGVTWAANADSSLSGLGPAVMLSIGDAGSSDLYLATWTTATNSIVVYKSTDDAANWTGVCTIYSSEGPKGLAWFEDPDGDEYPYLRTYEGTWRISAVPVKIVDTTAVGDEDDAQGMCVWQELLAIPEGEDMILRDKDGLNTPMGFTARDGFPEDYKGHVTALIPARFHLFAASSGTYCAIHAHNGQGWHPVFVDTTAGRSITSMHVSGNPEFPTLFFSLGADTHRYIENYHENPLEISDAEYEEEAFIQYPRFGGSLTEADSVFFSVQASAERLTNDGEEIDILYQVHSGDDYKFLGTLNESTTLLRFPDQGLIAKSIKLKAILKRGDSIYKTPILNYIAVEFQQLLGVLTVLEFEIDCKETENMTERSEVVQEAREIQRGSGLLNLRRQGVSEEVLVYTLSTQIVETKDSAVCKIRAVELVVP